MVKMKMKEVSATVGGGVGDNLANPAYLMIKVLGLPFETRQRFQEHFVSAPEFAWKHILKVVGGSPHFQKEVVVRKEFLNEFFSDKYLRGYVLPDKWDFRTFFTDASEEAIDIMFKNYRVWWLVRIAKLFIKKKATFYKLKDALKEL